MGDVRRNATRRKLKFLILRGLGVAIAVTVAVAIAVTSATTVVGMEVASGLHLKPKQ